MEYETILVPTDGSEGIDRTLDHALQLASDHGATVHALYVVDQRLELAADDETRESVRANLEEEAESAVGAVADRAAAVGVDCVTTIREGVPDKVIVDYADQQDADVIVIGTHGRTGRDRIAHLGSVTDRVVESAARPVFVVHIGEQ